MKHLVHCVVARIRVRLKHEVWLPECHTFREIRSAFLEHHVFARAAAVVYTLLSIHGQEQHGLHGLREICPSSGVLCAVAMNRSLPSMGLSPQNRIFGTLCEAIGGGAENHFNS